MAAHPGGLVPFATGSTFTAGSTLAQIQPVPCYVIPASAVQDYGRDALAVLNQCVCMQAWSSVTGRTCPVHGYIGPSQITC